MASDMDHAHRSATPIRPLPVYAPPPACHRHPDELLQRRPPRVVIDHARPFVETPRVPRVSKAELLEVEMVAELVAQGAQKCPEGRDFLSHCRPHPDSDQHRVGGVVAESVRHFGSPRISSLPIELTSPVELSGKGNIISGMNELSTRDALRSSESVSPP